MLGRKSGVENFFSMFEEKLNKNTEQDRCHAVRGNLVTTFFRPHFMFLSKTGFGELSETHFDATRDSIELK